MKDTNIELYIAIPSRYDWPTTVNMGTSIYYLSTSEPSVFRSRADKFDMGAHL